MPKTTGIVLDVARQRGGAMPGVVTLHDHSRFGNDGVMTDVTWTQLPSGLWVMNFNGTSSEVNCGQDKSLELRFPFTVEYWLQIISSDIYGNIVDKWYQPICGVRKVGDFTQVQSHLYVGGPIAGHFWSTGYLPYPGWGHSVITYDGADVKFYIQGSFDSSIPETDQLDETGHDLIIGYRIGTEKFGGRVSPVTLYTYALTPAQIRSKFQATRRLFGV